MLQVPLEHLLAPCSEPGAMVVTANSELADYVGVFGRLGWLDDRLNLEDIGTVSQEMSVSAVWPCLCEVGGLDALL